MTAIQIDRIAYDSGRPMTVLGVPGRLTHRTVKPGLAPGLWFNQRWISEPRPAPAYHRRAVMRVELRFDDECGNGKNSFAITADIGVPGANDIIAGGCLHDEIERIFPELAPLIQWHLTSTAGPMHYIANTVYLAGDRDADGRRAGEPTLFDECIQFGENPIKHKVPRRFNEFLAEADNHGYDFEVIRIDAKNDKPHTHRFSPKYTFGGYECKWHECPFDTETEALDFLTALQRCNPRFISVPVAWSMGKTRDLHAARRAAIWPDATDEQLSLPPEELRALLEARLPDLLARFSEAMIECGFFMSPDDCEKHLLAAVTEKQTEKE